MPKGAKQLSSGLIFIPDLSSTGVIAVKNPFITDLNDPDEIRLANRKVLDSILDSKKQLRLSLVDILFIICQVGENKHDEPLAFEIDQELNFTAS